MNIAELSVALVFAAMLGLAVRRLVKKGSCEGCAACKGGANCHCKK